MNLTRGTVILAVAALAACGTGKPKGIVQFHGFPPNTSLQNAKMVKAGIVRGYTTYCPGPCGKEIEFGLKQCPLKKSCGVYIDWPKEYTCGSCKGTGLCNACVWMDQMPDGLCYNCRGKEDGNLIFFGQAKPCPNCKGDKKCPICKGTKQCDWCKGVGVVSDEFVKAHLMKTGAESELPETPAKTEEKKPDEKKPDEKKTDEKKPEDK